MGLGQFWENVAKGLPYRGQTISGVTGTMAAGLTSGSTVWAFRYPAAATRRLLVARVHQHYVTVAGYTTAITAGRRLHLLRGSGADPSSGTVLDVDRKASDEANEVLVSGRIATTSGVNMSGVSFESAVKRRMLLTAPGYAGSDLDEEWRYDALNAEPLILLPGQLAAAVAGQTFDAGGTWQLNFSADVIELP